MKSVAILQSNYIPWKGYFDLIAAVDEFVLYDDMQFTRRDWRNRNRIKTADGIKWLTIPVSSKGNYLQKIQETRIIEDGWRHKHFQTIQHSYRKAPFFDEVTTLLEPLYQVEYPNLSELNAAFLKTICQYLGISTEISRSSEYRLSEGKTERLLNLCQQTGAGKYLSGPAAKSYVDEELFRQANVELAWFDYSGYPEYQQLHGDFAHDVSIIDLMFQQGRDSTDYMKCGKPAS